MVCECNFGVDTSAYAPQVDLPMHRYSTCECVEIPEYIGAKFLYEGFYTGNSKLKRSNSFFDYFSQQFGTNLHKPRPFSFLEVNFLTSGFKAPMLSDSILYDIPETDSFSTSGINIPFEFCHLIIKKPELIAILLFINDLKFVSNESLNKEFDTLIENMSSLINELIRFDMITSKDSNLRITLNGKLSVLKIRQLEDLK